MDTKTMIAAAYLLCAFGVALAAVLMILNVWTDGLGEVLWRVFATDCVVVLAGLILAWLTHAFFGPPGKPPVKE